MKRDTKDLWWEEEGDGGFEMGGVMRGFEGDVGLDGFKLV